MTETPSLRPREFRYRERAHHASQKAIRRLARTLGFDPTPSEALVSSFEASYYRGDPLADAYVRTCLSRGGLHAARTGLDHALAHGLDDTSSPELRALFADLEARPAWLDDARVARGARVFRRYGSTVFRFAGTITLGGYLESSVAKPLALSGGYVGHAARQRFLETASFWIEVSEPRGLARGAPGYLAALRVRLLHATVRARLTGHREWNEEAWGVPISEGDALLTLMGGSIAPGLGLALLGYRTSRTEIEDLLHFWRWVGHLMGARFSPYPETVEDALRLSYVAALKGSRTAGEDGRALCAAYVAAFEPALTPHASLLETLRARLEHGLHRGITRLFLPPSVYRAQALPPAGLWPILPLLPAPFVFAAETLRRRSPTLDELADTLARRERRAWLAHHTRGHDATFRPNETLRR
jgi:hypothetical protein